MKLQLVFLAVLFCAAVSADVHAEKVGLSEPFAEAKAHNALAAVFSEVNKRQRRGQRAPRKRAPRKRAQKKQSKKQTKADYDSKLKKKIADDCEGIKSLFEQLVKQQPHHQIWHVYKVKPKESAYAIAKAHGVDMANLRQADGSIFPNLNDLEPNMCIRIYDSPNLKKMFARKFGGGNQKGGQKKRAPRRAPRAPRGRKRFLLVNEEAADPVPLSPSYQEKEHSRLKREENALKRMAKREIPLKNIHSPLKQKSSHGNFSEMLAMNKGSLKRAMRGLHKAKKALRMHVTRGSQRVNPVKVTRSKRKKSPETLTDLLIQMFQLHPPPQRLSRPWQWQNKKPSNF